jgi:hypothetical protein
LMRRYYLRATRIFRGVTWLASRINFLDLLPKLVDYILNVVLHK